LAPNYSHRLYPMGTFQVTLFSILFINLLRDDGLSIANRNSLSILDRSD
jgi:hypothetical protein